MLTKTSFIRKQSLQKHYYKCVVCALKHILVENSLKKNQVSGGEGDSNHR